MISIARDTYTGTNQAAATPSYKINSLFQYGAERLTAAVAKVTGFDVTNYLVIDTAGLRKLVDVIGGVWYDVPIDMDYDDEGQKLSIHLTEGYQKLNGKQAEGLVRFRHNNDGSTYSYEYGMEDYGRNRTQREFAKEVIKQTVKANNIFKITELIDIASESIKTNMDLSVLKDYVPYAMKMDYDKIRTDRLPGVDKVINDYWFFIADKTKTAEMIQEMFTDIQDEVATPTKAEMIASLKIEVLNGSGSTTKLTKMTEKLEEAGFHITKTADTEETAKTSIMNRTSQPEKIEDAIKEAIGKGTIVAAETQDVDVTIIIGKDF